MYSRLAKEYAKETGERNLCLAGGVALNCVANGNFLREKILKIYGFNQLLEMLVEHLVLPCQLGTYTIIETNLYQTKRCKEVLEVQSSVKHEIEAELKDVVAKY